MRRACLLLSLVLLAPNPAAAGDCTGSDFRAIVDGAGASLRRLNADSQPRIEAAMRRLKEKNGWSESEFLEKAQSLLSDEKSDAYDAQASDLLAELDRLAEEPATGPPDCNRLGELQSTATELQATVRVKTQYLLARLEELAGTAPRVAAAVPAAPAQSAPAAERQPAAPAQQPQPQPGQPASKPAPQARAPAPPAVKAPPVKGSWTTSTVDDRTGDPARASDSGQPPPEPTSSRKRMPMPTVPASADGFTIDEIREASRGFFGSISGGLASVIEHSFAKLGRPTGYVLGNEGGGAFVAGVRYGNGTLVMRNGKSRKVYWHGPSIGYDIGAAGSKTLYLVYGLDNELDIFAGFSGVDGQAYLVGGVGMTVLTDGKIVMAPIRSGLGLRLGASIGYVRFTPRATWNPF